MIIVKLQGGLGNQMFQYAIGKNLSMIKNVPLKLDINFYKNNDHRKYLLNNYNIFESFASLEEVLKIGYRGLSGIYGSIYKRFQKILPIRLRTIIYENYLKPYNNKVLNTGKTIYLDGYWQSEKYFHQNRYQIKQLFSNPKRVSEDIMNYCKKILKCKSVSIHIRRGDYVTNPETSKVHGICSLEYYHKSMEFIASKEKDVQFFIFSDDLHWVMENFQSNYYFELVNFKDNSSPVEELWLMSQCKHHIIANSSFSWWGAWLSQNPQKMVIAPKKWFNQKTNTKDLLPSHWKQI
jgi:hypothetical protein